MTSYTTYILMKTTTVLIKLENELHKAYVGSRHSSVSHVMYTNFRILQEIHIYKMEVLNYKRERNEVVSLAR